MWLDVRETRRDARVIDDAVPMAGDVSWMAYFRKNSRGGKSEMGER